MCKFVIPLPSFVTLLSTEEDPYVNVDVILPYFRLVQRGPKWKHRVYALNHPALLFALLNIYHWRFGPSMNHVSFLEADTRVWKKKSNCEWIEPNFAFKIINFHLSYPLHLILFIIRFCISCVPCVQIATPLLPICLKRTRRTRLWIWQTLIFRRAKLRQTRGQTYHELDMVRNCVALMSWLQLKFVFVFLALKCLKIQTFRDYCPFIGERCRYTERA